MPVQATSPTQNSSFAHLSSQENLRLETHFLIRDHSANTPAFFEIMKKRTVFAPAIASLGLFFLYAFNFPKQAEQQFLTVFSPEKKRSVASNPNLQVRQARDEANLEVRVTQDTFEPLEERYDDFLNGSPNQIDLNDPAAVDKQVQYDPVTGQYIITEKIGDNDYRPPTYMTFDEYVKWKEKKQRDEYFDRLQGVSTGGSGKKNPIGTGDPVSKFDVKTSLVDRIFGSDKVDIKPTGNINLTFGANYQNIQNPILTKRQQRNTQFDFDMDINMGAQGKIGEKLNLNFNYNTQATFDFDNQMKLNYDTKNFSEDEILQNIEAGNVSMPLRSQLIKGAQNLFGLKTELKFGHLRLTTIAAQQRSRQNNLTVQGGAQVQKFDVPIDEYDENRHFFFSQYNRSEFENALRCLPIPMTLFKVNRMEVWITNDQIRPTETRDIVALADLGEPELAPRPANEPPYADQNPAGNKDINGKRLAYNGANDMYSTMASRLQQDSTLRLSAKVVGELKETFPGIRQIRDFEKQRCRLLNPSEYSFNDQLGFVSINLNVQPDQIVGVAVEYMYNGKPYKIGEFSSDFQSGDSLNQNVLFVKMLKSTTANVQLPIWDLMMKNIYGIGTANLDPQEFRFDIFYDNPGKGQVRFFNDPKIPQALNGKPFLQVFRLDTLNLQQDPGPDGIFDFVPGLTINLRSGRVMFPVLEPFGSFLEKRLLEAGTDTSFVRTQLIYQQLYDSTLFRAREFQHLNRFNLRGQFKSASNSEISLGTFNLPPGSVRVSGGGRQLIEGQDYEVDYNIGKVRILNDAILQSGQNVNVSFEDNALFGFQNRTMLGLRADYDYGKDMKFGATFMNLFERPLTQKVNFGDDPINNKMYGLDFSVSKEAPWLTKALDKLPFYSTKETSTISVQAEGALLDPGHAKAINQGDGRGGIVYIDDFEGSTSGIPLTTPANGWVLSSTPTKDDKGWINFPEAELSENLAYSANRAKMSWYIADPSARDAVDANNPYTRLIQYQDLFPNRQLTPLEQSNLRPLDVTIYPRERGPYNYDLPALGTTEGGYPGISEGLTQEGELKNPKSRWTGFMRGLNTNDFEAANIEFVEFWVLNPFMEKGDGTAVSESGEMFIDLGSINEDLMKDGRQFFENALGVGATVDTKWGRVPAQAPVVLAFDNDPAQREKQDIGFDGLDDTGEIAHFDTLKVDGANSYLQRISNGALNSDVKAAIQADPSADNFVYYLDEKFNNVDPGLLERYRNFNNPQGNSRSNQQQTAGPIQSSTNQPDVEDLNRDNSLNESEAFFRYKIPIKKAASGDSLDINDPILARLITDRQEYTRNGQKHIWYRFKVPLDNRDVRTTVGGIQDFRSIRFIRTVFKGFTEKTTFRFATFELGRNQWRRFSQQLPNEKCDQTTVDPTVAFDVNSVSIEENSARYPFNYTIPNGVQREQSVGAFPDVLQNEQSLSMEICNLGFCDAKAIFKTLNMDLRQYKRLKMFVHAEALNPSVFPLDTNNLSVFVRLGSDFYRNYYEYEIPLRPSDVNNLVGYTADSKEYKAEIWREENSFDFPLELFTEVKIKRNAAVNHPIGNEYFIFDPEKPKNKVKVVGNPNLGFVKGAMIGVRNVDSINLQRQCVEVWVNELRLNDFNESGGYAGLARMDVKLADLGNVAFSTGYTSPGWRGIEEKINQTKLETVEQFDVSANVEISKFLPEKLGLKIPFYVQHSQVKRTPKYDPYDLDLDLKEKIKTAPNAAAADSIRQSAEDITINRGYNFTNVRKEKGKKAKPFPWNVSNFSLTYAFNNEFKRNPFVVRDDKKQYKGGLDYQYQTGLKPIQPFKKVIKKDKYLKFITDFNFNPIPNTYGFSSNLERIFQTTTWRFTDDTDVSRNTFYNKRFTWDRDYDLGWDLTKGIKITFDALAKSLIDEPLEIDPATNTRISKEVRNDSIRTNFMKLGRPKSYNQNVAVQWTLPLKTIPMMDWVTLKASYTGGYTWTAASLKMQYLSPPGTESQLRNLGNVIQNTSVRQINGDLNFETLYNKSKYLAKINKGGKAAGGKDKKKKSGGGGDRPGGDAPSTDDPDGGGSDPRSGGRGGDDRTADDAGKGKGKDKASDRTEPRRDTKSDSKSDPTGKDKNIVSDDKADKAAGRSKDDKNPAGAAGTDDKKDGKGKDKKDKDSKGKAKEREITMAERIALRPLMLVRKGRFTYSENYGSVIPGFLPEPKLMGLSEGFQSPGWGYVFGFQPNDKFLDNLAAESRISHRPELNQEATRTFTQNMDAGVTIEPFKDFRIELNANRQFTKNRSELFKDQNFTLGFDSVNFEHRAMREMGSFTTSFFSMNTLFGRDINDLFQTYENYRPIISNRLAAETGNLNPHEETSQDSAGYKYGYGRIQQEVLIPAFLAAYTEKDPNTVNTNIFKTRPAVNWKLNYNGLSKIGKLNKIFNSVQISHGYKNTLQVNSYSTDLFYVDLYNQQTNPYPYDPDLVNFNYIARYEIPQVMINESFAPLLGIDVKLKNEMTFKLDMKKSRTLAMSFVDYQLAETTSAGYTFGFGYRVKNVNIPFLTGKKTGKGGKANSSKKKKKKKENIGNIIRGDDDPKGKQQQGNDLNFKFDFDFKDDITVNHRLDQADIAVPTRGAQTWTISPSVDYAINRKLKLRLFTDYRKTIPKTSASFPITTINGGVTVQFSLN